MQRHLNQETQPFREMPVFNNWNVVAKGWYVACPSRDLKKHKVKSVDICGQRVVVFRGDDGRVRALDAYCPHMGADLGQGKVIGNNIRCFFHHWSFNGDGQCAHIPCLQEGQKIPPAAKLHSYATEERYGLVWVFPEKVAPHAVVTPPDHENEEIFFRLGKAFRRPCHYHVNLLNGVDPQHLNTVHQVPIEKHGIQAVESGDGVLEFTFRSEHLGRNWKERVAKFLLGENDEFRVRYGDGCIACLSILRTAQLFGSTIKLPSLNMIYAYKTVGLEGVSEVQPIFLTKKRKGVWGFLLNRFLVWVMKRIFLALKDQDTNVLETIRFQPKFMFSVDEPILQFMGYINALEPSVWSRAQSSQSNR